MRDVPQTLSVKLSRAPVWRGSGLPTAEQGIKVLGTPLGHEDFVAAHLSSVLHAHQTLLERTLSFKTFSAWALLLHSAVARAKYQLRVVRPELTSPSQRVTMTVFGVVCARFCTLTLQQFTPASSPHSRSLSWRSGAFRSGIRTNASCADSLGVPQQTQQCGRRILGVSHCWCRTTVSGCGRQGTFVPLLAKARARSEPSILVPVGSTLGLCCWTCFCQLFVGSSRMWRRGR